MSHQPIRKDELLAIPIAGRISWLAVERGRLEVDGHCLALVRENDLVEIPPAAFAALIIEPGVSITHEAVKLCAENRTAIFWVGEGGTRLYSATSIHANAARILDQSSVHLDPKKRISAARRLYAIMFGEPALPSFSIEKLRGIEGAKVRAMYESLSIEHGVTWNGRASGDALQQKISYGSSCLYSLSEIAILMLGFSPSIGIVHSGDSRSFVYDLADTVKFNNLVPALFAWHAAGSQSDFSSVRVFCRDLFRTGRLLDTLIYNANWIVYGTDRRDSQ